MGAFDVIKDVIEVTQKAGTIDVTKQLLDVQRELMDLQMENFELKKKIGELQDIIDKVKRIKYNENRSAVYVIHENGLEEGPYCTHCWEVNKKTISVQRMHGSWFECPHCKNKVKIYGIENIQGDEDDAVLLT